MTLLILVFWLCIIGFAAGILIRATASIPMPDPFPPLVKGVIIIVALVAAWQLLVPYIPL